MKIVEILSKFGTDPTIIDMQGRNCLHHAASPYCFIRCCCLNIYPRRRSTPFWLPLPLIHLYPSASHSARFASFPGLRVSGGVTRRCLFWQWGSVKSGAHNDSHQCHTFATLGRTCSLTGVCPTRSHKVVCVSPASTIPSGSLLVRS